MSAVAQQQATGSELVRGQVLIRAGLVLVAAAQAEVGIWGLVSPHGFFTGFPGGGHHWVASIGTYNEHLIRDYAASELGLALLVAAMAVWFERRLVLVGGAALLLATVPHFVYHLTTTDSLSTADNAASLGAFALELLLVAIAMVAVTRDGRVARQSVESPDPQRSP
jgi:hypothetical protein